MKKLYFAIITLFGFLGVKALPERDLPAYQNRIVKITEIQGQSKNTVRIVFQNLHPIITYAPKSFAESQNTLIHRYILPYTSIDQDFENDTISIKQDLEHVQVLVIGKLLMQTTGVDSVIFVTA